jgi:ATP-dependent Lon protease
MRAIKEELGDNDDDEDDVAALERKMQSAGMPSNIWKHAQRELRYVFLDHNLLIAGFNVAIEVVDCYLAKDFTKTTC